MIPVLEEDNVRQGFLEQDEYEKIAGGIAGRPEGAVCLRLPYWRPEE